MKSFLKKIVLMTVFLFLFITCQIFYAHASLVPSFFMDSPDSNHQFLGLAFYDGNYWVATSASGGRGPSSIYKVDGSGTIIEPYSITSINQYINGLAVDNSGSLYSFDQFWDRMIKHDTDIVSSLSSYNGPYGGSAGPRSLAYGVDYLWGLTNDNQQELFKIDPVTLDILTTYTRPAGLTGITWVNDKLWGVEWGDDGNGYLHELALNVLQFEIINSWVIEGVSNP